MARERGREEGMPAGEIWEAAGMEKETGGHAPVTVRGSEREAVVTAPLMAAPGSLALGGAG